MKVEPGADASQDKKTSSSKVTKKAEKKPKKPGDSDSDADVKLSDKGKKLAGAHDEKKSSEKKPSGPEHGGPSSTTLSPAGKEASPQDRELHEAETLMDHIENGKLSQDEHDMAMKRVNDLLKRYGKA